MKVHGKVIKLYKYLNKDFEFSLHDSDNVLIVGFSAGPN